MKVKYDFNPFGKEYADIRVSGDIRDELLDELKEFVQLRVLDYLSQSRSPVTGKAFKGLSKDYSEFKKSEVGNSSANLQLTGDLWESIEVVDAPGGGIRLTVNESNQAKADGHNNFSGKSRLPSRKFIPNQKAGEKFTKELKDEIVDFVFNFVDFDEAE